MKSLAILLMLAAIPPLAAADCVGPACVTETSFQDGACAEGGSEGGTTRADVEGVASASGSWYCSGSTRENTLAANAGGFGVQWTELSFDDPENGSFRGCHLFVLGTFHACPAGLPPPNPGWGALLP